MRAALGAVGLCVALLGSAQARPLADPIVGTWSRPGGGAVSIAATGTTTFVGAVAVAYPSTNGCVHQVGKQVWEITARGGGSYTGTNHGFASGPPACPDSPQAAAWTVKSPAALAVCVLGGCGEWTRPAPALTRFAWSVRAKRVAKHIVAIGAGRFAADARGRIAEASGTLGVTAGGSVRKLRISGPGNYVAHPAGGIVSLVAEVVNAVGPAKVACAADPLGTMIVFAAALGEPRLTLTGLCGESRLELDGRHPGTTIIGSIRKTG